MQKTKLSIIIPCLNEAEGISELNTAVTSVLGGIDGLSELIFVDDGSTDETLEIIKNQLISTEKIAVRYISFSRNFGKEAAMLAGLSASKGDYVALIDADFQDDPNLLLKMYQTLEREDCDCVAVYRSSRKNEPKIRSAFSKGFYWLMGKLSQVGAVDGERDYRMMRRKVVKSILSLPEKSRYSKGIFAWVGFKTVWLEENYSERRRGNTKWSFWSLCRYAINAILSFSTVPLVLSSYIGILFCIISAIGIVITIIRQTVWGGSAYGWSSLVCIILMLSGVQLFCMGLLGQYLSKIYLETKNRPPYIVRESSDDEEN